MTASKPPDKTLVGMPSDLKAVLQKLDQAVADKATLIDRPPASDAIDKTKTHMGHGASERPRSAPPPLPPQRPAAAAPPHAEQLANAGPPRSLQPSQAANAGPGPAMDRTLIGMPSDMQAALQRALAEAGAAAPQAAPPRPAAPQQRASAPQQPPPSAAGSALRPQPMRAIGVPGAPPSAAQASGSSARGYPVPPSAAHGYDAPPVPAQRGTVQTQLSGPPAGGAYPSGLGYHSGSGYQPEQFPPGSTAMKALAPQAPLDWPPAAGRSDSGLVPRADGLAAGSPPPVASVLPPLAAPPAPDQFGHEPSTPRGPAYVAAQPALSLQPGAAAQPARPEPALGMQPTRLAPLTPSAGAGAEALNAGGSPTAQAPRLALPLTTQDGSRKTKKLSDTAPKRWPAISLILLAVFAFGGVIVLRAPHLLPAALSEWLVPTPAVPEEMLAQEANAAAPAPELPSAPAAELSTDKAAATDPAKAVPTPTPTRPPAAPALTIGASALLEKKAIERLIANDYVTAKQLYEKLRSAEPSRSEFAVMVELLSRTGGAPCGQPGQPPCAGPRP